jgi:hypothetical protein
MAVQVLDDEYRCLNYLLHDSSNSLEDVPKTKRHLELVLEERLQRDRCNIVIGGLRNIGKTIILKQLALEYEKSLYVSFQYIAFDNNTEVFDEVDVMVELIHLMQAGNIKILLLDEVTRIGGYSSVIKQIFDSAKQHGVSVIVTGSLRHALRNQSVDTWGCRCSYVELGALSFYEYLCFTHKFDNVLWTENFYELKSLKAFCDNYDISEDSFIEYLQYSASYFNQDIKYYVDACYNDLIFAEGKDIVSTVDDNKDIVEAADKLFCVLQYKLLERFNSKDKFLNLAGRNDRDKRVVRQMYLDINSIKSYDARLRQYVSDLKNLNKSIVVSANKMLRLAGMLYPVLKKSSDSDMSDLKRDAVYQNNGGAIDVDDLYSNPCFTSNINLYMALVKDFLFNIDSDMKIDFANIFKGSYKGALVEYYVVSQEAAVSQNGYSMKLELDNLQNACEIDILSEKSHSLIEVGIENKSPKELAFCDENFTALYPEYRDFKKVYVSARPNADESNGYLEVPYWKFGVYCDMVKIRRYIDSTN